MESVLCCQCGISIEPNTANMCVSCVRCRVDITENIPRSAQLIMCKLCSRYLQPPDSWLEAAPESKQLLSLCLKRLKGPLAKKRLTDAGFIWTEPHSKRIKLKMTLQEEFMIGSVLQQELVVEFTVRNQLCTDCQRGEAKDFWRACVQVRQRCRFKKTLFYLEQLIIKQGLHLHTTAIKPVSTGIDLFYARLQDARKLIDFIQTCLPCRYQYAQELVSHDPKNNIFDYKHTFAVQLVPICRDDIVCLPKQLAQSLGNMSQLAIVLRVTNVISLIDPCSGAMAELNAETYWRHPFHSLTQCKWLSQLYVLDVEAVDVRLYSGHGPISHKHHVCDVWTVPADRVGVSGVDPKCSRSHLGHLLNPGDTVLGFDIGNCNANNQELDNVASENLPDIVLIKKTYAGSRRGKRRWKLGRLPALLHDEHETTSATDFEEFMQELEEDAQMRHKINIYRKESIAGDEQQMQDEHGPALAEMLDDLHLNDTIVSQEP